MIHLSAIHKTVFLFIFFSFLLVGCLGSRDWEYPPLPDKHYLEISSQRPIAATLVVLPLEDQRGKVMKEEYNSIGIPLISLVQEKNMKLYGKIVYDRPEDAVDPQPIDRVNFDPPYDFAQAVADEIREANIFSSAVFADGATIPPSDFVLRGSLQSTRWERSITAYSLGPLGPLAWLSGLPMGSTTTEIRLNLRLSPASDATKVLWNFSLDFSGWQRDGAYYGLQESIKSYPLALQTALSHAVRDLAEKAPAYLGNF